METNRLEEFIKANRAEFDQMEPSPKVWENISKSSKKHKILRLNTMILRVAAVVVFVILASVLLLKTNILSPERMAQNNDPELRELMEAETYYAQQVDGKLKEIRKCYYTYPELKDEVETDLNELQKMYNNLKLDLEENISNKAVIEAMIENNRIRLKLVDDVLEQIKC